MRFALAVMVAVAPLAGAQDKPTQGQSAAKPFKPEELEQIVAPIALYPDGAVAQVLMASTYPIEVIDAARFAKSNANLKGDALNEALKKQSWDDSVKSLVSFPQILTMMSDKLDWTQKLGDAFLGQRNPRRRRLAVTTATVRIYEGTCQERRAACRSRSVAP
jgi:hypothetical protein